MLHTDIEIMKHLHPQILQKRQQRQGSRDDPWTARNQEPLGRTARVEVQVRTFSIIESSF